ncbi:MAG TPA: hypothetical protein PK771_07495, partial [Spirochaetota bacterium]|nr:hypothetical protein [Spirochaetota bacterium]
MPKYEDLDFLKNKMFLLANEPEILEKKNETPNLSTLPEKVEIKEESNFIDTDDLLKDINDDFSEGLAFSEDENELDTISNTENEDKDNFLDNISFDDITKEDEILENEPLSDNLLDNYDGKNKKDNLEKANDWEDLKDDSFNSLDSISFEDEKKESLDSGDGIDEMSAILNDVKFDTPPNEEIKDDFNLDDLSFDNQPKEEVKNDFNLDD